jgi:hypothetical protein
MCFKLLSVFNMRLPIKFCKFAEYNKNLKLIIKYNDRIVVKKT